MSLSTVKSQPAKKKDCPTVDTCWHVVAITATVTALAVSLERTSSFLLVAIMEEFGVDRQTASWPLSIMTSLSSVTGLFVGLLQKRYPIRYIMLVGSVLTWTGVLTSGFATSTRWLILTMGVIHGTGLGFMYVTTKYFAMMYFDKLRGVAMGITTLGISMAGFVFPKVLLYLGDTYSFEDSLFILGAISMNLTSLTYLLKVPPWCKPTKQYESTESIPSLTFACAPELGIHQQERQQKKPSLQSLPGSSSLVCNPIFHVVVLSAAVSQAFEICFLSSMTDFCQDKGLTTTDAVWLTSCFTLAGVLGRLCVPLLADKALLRRSTLLMLLYLLLASVMMSAPYASTYWSLAAIEAFASIFTSSAIVLHDVVVVDYFGLKRLTTVYGIIGVVKAPLLLCNPLILGFFRDRTGSYDDMYRFCAGVVLFLSVVWLAIVCCERRNIACVDTLRRGDTFTSKNGRQDMSPHTNTEECHK